MDLAVIVDCDYAHNGLGRFVASEHHRACDDIGRIAGIAKNRPAESVVVQSVEVSGQIDPAL